MGRIPESTIQEVRDRADIVGLIGRYVELKQAGRNWKGLCPFHDEKTPSFNVSPDRQIYHCFGCEVGGDAISFVSRYENLTFPEAVRSLAGELGIEIPETGGAREERGESERIYAALELAQKCYREQLAAPDGKPGRDYLESRDIPSEVVEHFGIGYVPEAWDTVAIALRRAGVSGEVGAEAGLLIERSGGGHYDRLRGRVIFPIYDVRGRVIAFGGRALSADQEPKYLNSPESRVFQKRRAFYGFPHALEPIRRSRRAIVCEGYFDAIALHRAGLGEAVATCGTALTEEHAKQLKRRTNDVSLLFDGDHAGQQAMERALAVLLPAGLRVRAVSLPAGQDPDDFLCAEGAEALRKLVDVAPDAIDAVMRRAMIAGCTTPAEKSDVVRRVAPFIAQVSDPVERSEYARRLAVATAADAAAVEAVVREFHQGRGVGREHEVAPALASPRRASPEDRHVKQLAVAFMRAPHLATGSRRERMDAVLPSGDWKSFVFDLLAAADEGHIDEHGGLDVRTAASRFEGAARARFHELSLDETLADHSEAEVEAVVGHLLDRYESKQIDAEKDELKRRMQDPREDPIALLRERQVLLERKRAVAGLSSDSRDPIAAGADGSARTG